jgi:hypothetical protein
MRLRYRAVEALSIIMLCIIVFVASAEADTFQRLLILPQTITIAGGGADILHTHCLDRFAHAPPGGASYGYAPSDLGNATVTVGSGPTLTLQQAIDTKRIRVEGFGNGRYSDSLRYLAGSSQMTHLPSSNQYQKIRIINLVPDVALKISIPSPSIIAPDNGYPVDDLRGIYPKIIAVTNELIDNIDKEVNLLSWLEEFKKKSYLLYYGQEDIWKLRRDNSAHKLSDHEAERLSSIGVPADESEFYNETVKYGLGHEGKGAFFVMRCQHG